MSTHLDFIRDATPFADIDHACFQHLQLDGVCEPLGADSFDARWGGVVDELLRIRTLTDDWDGEGSIAPEAMLVDRALKIATCFKQAHCRSADRVHAGVNGTVFFEWHLADGYQEVEVLDGYRAESRWLANGANESEIFELVP